MKKVSSKSDSTPIRPATTPEARENQLIAMATNLAEEQLRNGTASSQVISFYLKLGSSRGHLENELLKKQNELAQAKKEALESTAKIEQLYTDAMNAMRRYSGQEHN